MSGTGRVVLLRSLAVLVVVGALAGGALACWHYLVDGAAAARPDPSACAPRQGAAASGAAPAAPKAAPAFLPGTPLPAARVRVRVWNSTSTAGLAGRVGDELARRGFVLSGGPRNDDPAHDRPEVTAEVRYGRAGAGAALAVAAHVPAAVPVLDRRRGPGVDLVLHQRFDGLRRPADAVAAAAPVAVPQPTAATC